MNRTAPLADRYQHLEAEHKVAEAELFREAFEQAGWLERPAASLLGIPRSTFKRRLEHYPEIRDEAAAARRAMGYTTGNPEIWAKANR